MMSLLREQGSKLLADAKAQTEAAAIAVDTVLHDCFTGRIFKPTQRYHEFTSGRETPAR